MNAFVRSTLFVVLTIGMMGASISTFNYARNTYSYSGRQGAIYLEGCPYTLTGAMCRWTAGGYSGFRIGMSRREVLAILCEGNADGRYTPPLNVDKKPDFEADSRVSIWEPQHLVRFPCAEPERLDGYLRMSFERQANALELRPHREIFGLVFTNDRLSLIQVHRSLIYIDL